MDGEHCVGFCRWLCHPVAEAGQGKWGRAVWAFGGKRSTELECSGWVQVQPSFVAFTFPQLSEQATGLASSWEGGTAAAAAALGGPAGLGWCSPRCCRAVCPAAPTTKRAYSQVQVPSGLGTTEPLWGHSRRAAPQPESTHSNMKTPSHQMVATGF